MIANNACFNVNSITSSLNQTTTQAEDHLRMNNSEPTAPQHDGGQLDPMARWRKECASEQPWNSVAAVYKVEKK